MQYDINQLAANVIGEFEDPVILRYTHNNGNEELEAHGDLSSLLTGLVYMTDKLIATVDDYIDENGENDDGLTEEDLLLAKQVCFSQVFMLLVNCAKHVGYPMGALREIIEHIEEDKDA